MIFLAIATLLIASMFFLRMTTIASPDGDIIIRYHEKTSYLIMLIIASLGHICSLASVKIPMLQARMANLTALITLGFQILLIFSFVKYSDSFVFSITALFPLAASFLDFLAGHAAMVDSVTIEAVKAIRKSEKKRK